MKGATLYTLPREGGPLVGKWCLRHHAGGSLNLGGVQFTDGESGEVLARVITRVLAAGSGIRAVPLNDAEEALVVSRVGPHQLQKLVLDCCGEVITDEDAILLQKVGARGDVIGLRSGELRKRKPRKPKAERKPKPDPSLARVPEATAEEATSP